MDTEAAKKDNVWEITGRTAQTQLVSEFMLELKKLAYFKEVKLTSIMKKKATSGDEGIDFNLACILK